MAEPGVPWAFAGGGDRMAAAVAFRDAGGAAAATAKASVDSMES